MRNWSGTAWTSQTSTDMWIIWGSSWRSWYSGNHLAASRTLQKPLSVNTVVFTNEGSNTTAKREKKIQSKNLYSGHELRAVKKYLTPFWFLCFVCVYLSQWLCDVLAHSFCKWKVAGSVPGRDTNPLWGKERHLYNHLCSQQRKLQFTTNEFR